MPNQSNQPHTFDLAQLDAAIVTTQFHGHLHHLVSTPSTNDLALKAAQRGARNGVWIADQQIAGRGRGAHTWHSPAGDPLEPAGLYMTALIAPPIPMQNALALSLRVAIAVQSAIASTHNFRIREEIDIRWPNDLLLNGKKCGGILIDTASNPATPTRPATLRYAILGIGINLNHTTFPPELEPIATSIRTESFTRSVEDSTKCRREPLAAAILIALDAHIRRLTQPATDNLQPATLSSWIQGKRVRVEARDGHASYTGTTAGLNPQGFLLVAGDDGQIHTVLSGGLREP